MGNRAQALANGIREVSDWCKAHGIPKTIVWFEPERVRAGTWLTENHPEWIFGGKDGGLLKIGDPQCRAWLVDRIDKILIEQGIDVYRQDFNIEPLAFWRAADAEDRQGISEIRHVEATSPIGCAVAASPWNADRLVCLGDAATIWRRSVALCRFCEATTF